MSRTYLISPYRVTSTVIVSFRRLKNSPGRFMTLEDNVSFVRGPKDIKIHFPRITTGGLRSESG